MVLQPLDELGLVKAGSPAETSAVGDTADVSFLA
jgi:hypothetical protein